MTPQETIFEVELPLNYASESDDLFEVEKRTFEAMREQLLSQYEGQYVAIHKGQVVDHDSDKLRLGLRVYRQFGYQPIYVKLVTREEIPVKRIASPKLRG
ncbi:MAG TPA: DUF5678 domain-containing protein, partial [Blastocatellia bacterium]|nr:DUF5678 domain-containing protein [Blastocatellia bacterium]